MGNPVPCEPARVSSITRHGRCRTSVVALSVSTVNGDGRSAVKVRHRRAILTAAVELIEQDDGARFTADELAARSGVARRTIFNHFGTLDDVLLAVCTDTLRVATEQLRAVTGPAPAGDSTREAMFTDLARALRRADLSGPITQVWRALGGLSGDGHRTQAFAQQALALTAAELSAQLTARHPGADPLEVELLSSLLTHGVGVVAGHWLTTARPGRPPSRAEWERLLERLLDRVGTGYLPRTEPPAQVPDREPHRK